eukprot:CAMPEP_0202922478 /NCGR_PEP_ID=MMETSP1392-20130828/77944_1 /ASSEMBLY_ACC=CAM_ASM_000868 /TAXON_ID=225041 /ORGANISM="Chlamydomonas chlamydogama, Strain SAG 11-48b" /LENGTH=282 /DNA_ID=CAMNT_0049616107 /DNA_START=116 /DNA_END=964 /DNA_ORIENTATION=+
MASITHLTLLCLTVLIAHLIGTNAHAGHFHKYPDTPSARNYIRQSIGSVSSWTTYNTSAYGGNLSVSGSAVVWVYLYKNCTDIPSTAFEFNITITAPNGTALALLDTSGQTFIGSCADPLIQYLHTPAAGADPDNMLFWTSFKTSAAGGIQGNAANGFIGRGLDANGTLEGYPMTSLVISTPQTGPLLCGDLQLLPRPPPEFFAQGEYCDALPPPPAGPCTADNVTAAGQRRLLANKGGAKGVKGVKRPAQGLRQGGKKGGAKRGGRQGGLKKASKKGGRKH